MWYRTVPALADRYRLISVDNRGAGRTGDVVGAPYAVETMTADLLAVLDAAGVEQAHVVGLSMGGTMAQELALSHPQRVRSLTLMATHPGAAVAVWDAEALDVLTQPGRGRDTRRRGDVGPVQLRPGDVPGADRAGLGDPVPAGLHGRGLRGPAGWHQRLGRARAAADACGADAGAARRPRPAGADRERADPRRRHPGCRAADRDRRQPSADHRPRPTRSTGCCGSGSIGRPQPTPADRR